MKRNPIAKAVTRIRQAIIPDKRRAIIDKEAFGTEGEEYYGGGAVSGKWVPREPTELEVLAYSMCEEGNVGWTGVDRCEMRGRCPSCISWAREVLGGGDE
jgi:hypothetical protein